MIDIRTIERGCTILILEVKVTMIKPGVEGGGWTVDLTIRVRFPHSMWALCWQGGKRRSGARVGVGSVR